jgi:hypothetical protein
MATVSTSGKLGVNYAQVDTVPQFPLGTIDEGNNGSEFVYILANSAIAQYDAVGIDTSNGGDPLTKTHADAGRDVGAAQVAIASGSYGWVQRRGRGGKVNVLANTAAGAALYTTATAGKLSDTTTSQTKVTGIVTTTANGGSTAGQPATLTFPHAATF